MNKQCLPKWLAAIALTAAVPLAQAQATDPLPPETVLVGVTGAPTVTEENFSIATAEDLVVTLTDLQVPAALSTATVVVTQGGALVGNKAATAAASLAPPATTATLAIAGAVGLYTLQVFGAPNSAYSVGAFTVCVAPKANPSNCIQAASLSGTISQPAAASSPTTSTVSTTLTVTTAGTYTVTASDDIFPVALQTAPQVALFQGSTSVGPLPIPSGTQLTLNPGTYTLLAIAQADATIQAGLYGITISGPAGVAPVLNNTYPVGTLAASSQLNNPIAQMLTLQVTDFVFPSVLKQANALVSAGGTVLGSASSAAAHGPATFAAPGGTLQVWTYAAAATDAGTYEVDLTSPTGSLLSTASGVNNGNSFAFAYVTPALAAGSYQATATDFLFPGQLQALSFAVAQNRVLLAQAAMATTLNFMSAAAPAVLLVNAKPPAAGNGLFDINVQTAGAAPQLQFDQTQGVSLAGLFNTQTLNIQTAGNFNVTVTDLQFPAPFQDLDLVVSSGSTLIGKIIGGGAIPLAATPGTYQLTFVATPAAMQQYGMYALGVVVAVPPTVTLSASPTTVTAGAMTTLTWTNSPDATSCAGSGGAFAGNQPLNSSVAVAVPSTTTFMLTCTGPGGTSAPQSVTVTATSAATKSGGGGGVDPRLIGLLALLTARKVWVQRQTGRRDTLS